MNVKIELTPIAGLLLVKHDVFEDTRGFFWEVYRKDLFDAAGLRLNIVQSNHSRSAKNVLRGLHFQWDPPMGKIMRVTQGRAFLVAVDLRKGSPTLGKWYGVEVDAKDRIQIWAPASFARGFCALSDGTEIEYLTTGTYSSTAESGIRWNDPEIGIQWPIKNPIVSSKDDKAQMLSEWLQRPESNHFQFQQS